MNASQVVLGRMAECTAQFSASARQAPHGRAEDAIGSSLMVARVVLTSAGEADSLPLTMGPFEVDGPGWQFYGIKKPPKN